MKFCEYLTQLLLLVSIGLSDRGKHMVGGIVFYRHIFYGFFLFAFFCVCFFVGVGWGYMIVSV